MRTGALWGLLLVLVTTGLAPTRAAAQATDWPTRPVRLIVAYAAGGVADVMARLIAAPLRERLGQSVVVENRPGAGGTIGTQACAAAPSDGHTLCMGSQSSLVLAPMMMKAAQYDARASFTPVTLLAYLPNLVVVRPELGVRTPDQLLAWLRAHPGAGWGTSGTGTTNHLTAVYLNREHGTRIEHVAYRGGSLAVEDLLAGHIPVVMDQISSSLPHVRSGALVAVLQTGFSRAPALPDVPTFAESLLPRLRQDAFQAVLGPAGLPAAITAKLQAAIAGALADDATLRGRIGELGGVPVANAPDEFRAILAENVAIYRELADLAGMKPE